MKAGSPWAIDLVEFYKWGTQKEHMPVLYFYGKTDYMVGPEHYKSLEFPNLMLWESNGGISRLEDNEDLEKAILAYLRKHNF